MSVWPSPAASLTSAIASITGPAMPRLASSSLSASCASARCTERTSAWREIRHIAQSWRSTRPGPYASATNRHTEVPRAHRAPTSSRTKNRLRLPGLAVTSLTAGERTPSIRSRIALEPSASRRSCVPSPRPAAAAPASQLPRNSSISLATRSACLSSGASPTKRPTPGMQGLRLHGHGAPASRRSAR